MLGLTACAAPCAVKSPALPGPELTVLTYNVNFGLSGDPSTLAAIRGLNADMVFLQETDLAWERALRQALSSVYPHMAFRHSDGAGGLAVLSRFPFRPEEYLPSREGWFPAWRVVVESPLGPVQVLQVHLRPPVSDRGSWISGYFTTGDFRRREMEVFAAHLKPGLATMVVGDFNEGHGGKAVQLLRRRGLRDALRERCPDATTWHWQTSVGQITLPLDHLFYSADLVPRETRVLHAGRSDHFPVVATFQRRR
jgi:endonuclease/exonuclease/phosphatase (EEP) superfamily protein YafD